jgi:hypothetical protein
MIRAPLSNATTTTPRSEPRNHAATGRVTDDRIEPSDTILHTRTVARNTASAAPNAAGARTRNTPAPVATPLPPRPRRNGVKLCPRIARRPAAAWTVTLSAPPGR